MLLWLLCALTFLLVKIVIFRSRKSNSELDFIPSEWKFVGFYGRGWFFYFPSSVLFTVNKIAWMGKVEQKEKMSWNAWKTLVFLENNSPHCRLFSALKSHYFKSYLVFVCFCYNKFQTQNSNVSLKYLLYILKKL